MEVKIDNISSSKIIGVIFQEILSEAILNRFLFFISDFREVISIDSRHLFAEADSVPLFLHKFMFPESLVDKLLIGPLLFSLNK